MYIYYNARDGPSEGFRSCATQDTDGFAFRHPEQISNDSAEPLQPWKADAPQPRHGLDGQVVAQHVDEKVNLSAKRSFGWRDAEEVSPVDGARRVGVRKAVERRQVRTDERIHLPIANLS